MPSTAVSRFSSTGRKPRALAARPVCSRSRSAVLGLRPIAKTTRSAVKLWGSPSTVNVAVNSLPSWVRSANSELKCVSMFLVNSAVNTSSISASSRANRPSPRTKREVWTPTPAKNEPISLPMKPPPMIITLLGGVLPIGNRWSLVQIGRSS